MKRTPTLLMTAFLLASCKHSQMPEAKPTPPVSLMQSCPLIPEPEGDSWLALQFHILDMYELYNTCAINHDGLIEVVK
jgi:hypothetical protein